MHHGNRPAPETPLLVGLLADVSGSMAKAIDSARSLPKSRLESLRESLDDLVQKAADLSTSGDDRRIAPLLRIFAYGFGFGGPLAFFTGDSSPAVRDLLDLGDGGTTTPSIDTLAAKWPAYRRHFEGMARQMLGTTPMGEAFTLTLERLKRETLSTAFYGTPTVFVLSDGEPTDVEPGEVLEIAERLRDRATVVSCFVTGSDLTERRHLYGAEHPEWTAGAELMFQCASPVPHGSPFTQYLHEYGWRVDDGARLFAQVNQSEILTEFMNLILSPLRDVNAATPGKPTVRVFVSYSRRDAKYKTELLDYLDDLTGQGFEFWSDEQIETGDAWDEQVREKIRSSDIAIVLVSQAFLNSSYIQRVEVAGFLERRQQDGMVIYPVILSPCDWEQRSWLASTHSQPRGGQTVATAFERPPKRQALYLKIHRELASIGRRIKDTTGSG